MAGGDRRWSGKGGSIGVAMAVQGGVWKFQEAGVG